MLSLSAVTGKERTRGSVIPGENKKGPPHTGLCAPRMVFGLHAENIETPSRCIKEGAS